MIISLIRYIKDHGRTELAKNTDTSPAYLSQIAYGHRKAGPALARRIHQETHGTVPLHEIRPDVWPDPTP